MSVTAVVFDYGQVISFPPEHGVIEALARLAGLPAPLMEDLLWRFRPAYDRGTISGEEYYRTLLAEQGVRLGPERLRDLVQLDLDSWKRINPGTARLMEDVKAAGLKLGILSNMPHEFLAFARANIPLFSLPDAGVFSCEAQSIKPEKEIYQALLRALDCPPAEACFFDDMPQNVRGAAEQGIKALLWRDPETARGELRSLGVPV
ncbi:MAG: HAD family phosphatase [Treponema sp.]|jgi:putative hydrolase of the HAD superfamily|nr:HAD family phosphatase [Treponema sp.]